ncbi:MAG: ABC transporter permease [Acidobacteriota bacterium]
MRPILLLALNDLRLTARDRASLVWMLIMPVALMWFFGQMDGAGSGPPRATLTVIDRDGGWLARALLEELRDEQIRLREISPEAEAGHGEGDRVRTLVIPEGFTEKALAGERQTLRLERDPGASEEFTLAAETHLIRSIVSILGRLIEMSFNPSLPGARSGLAAVDQFRRLGEREPLVRLDVSTAGRGRPVPRGFAQSVPGMLTMTVLMMTVIYGGVFLTLEKRERMLSRQGTLPIGRAQLFLGKLLGRLLMAGLQAVVLVGAGRYLFGLSFGRSPAGLALLLASYAAAVAGLATMLGALLRTTEQASALGWMLSMVLAAMGGCWWPSEVMPRWLWTAAHALPTAWAMDAFHALISFGLGLQAVLLPSAVLFGFGALFAAVGCRYLRTA